jgi:hypothetical protein
MALAPNPKKAFGDKKPALGQLPLVGKIHTALALMDGALKYGFRNWRKDPVEALTYVHAAERHLELYKEGEDLTRDTRVKNLGAVAACCMILMDAEANGTLIDNRSPSKAACDALYDAEAVVAMLVEMQRKREADKAGPGGWPPKAPEAAPMPPRPWKTPAPFETRDGDDEQSAAPLENPADGMPLPEFLAAFNT